jgi:transposase
MVRSTTHRRRLNRGGDRRANAALYRIVLTRSRGEQRTRDYLDRRSSQGMTRRKAIRCVKRYVAREVYQLLRELNPAQQALRTT